MVSKTKTLRPYQDALRVGIVDALSEGVRDILLHAPPASGKTLMTWAVVAKAIQDGLFDLVLVVSPTGQIKEQWTKREKIDSCGEILTYDATKIEPSQVCSVKFWRGAGVFTACHAGALAKRVGDFLSKEKPDLRTCLVVVDEAHHTSTVNVSGDTIKILLELGATVLRSTGTPWHRKGDVKLETTRVFGLSSGALARQRDEKGRPYAPQHFIALQEQVSFETDDESLAVDNGEKRARVEPSEYRDVTLESILQRWVKDGCPKVVVNLPRVEWAKGTSKKPEHGLVARIMRNSAVRKVLGRAPRVCDLTGEQTGAERVALDNDRDAMRWDDTQIDIILSCHRANEGMDWKWCSDVYNVGVPGSLVLLIQRWCRASRSKVGLVGYPRAKVSAGNGKQVAQNDMQRMTFFVPVLTDDAQDRLWRLHHEHALLAACMLECYEVGLQWASSVHRPEEFGQGLVGRAEDTRAARRVHATVDMLIAEAEDCGDLDRVKALNEIVKHMPADGSRMTGTQLGAIVDRLVEGRTPEQAAALISASEVLVAASSGDGLASTAAARERRRKEAATMAAQGKSPAFIRSAIRASKAVAFREFVEKHGADLVVSIPAGVRRNAVVFTGYDTERLGAALRAMTPPPWYGMQLAQMQTFARAAAERYFARTGKRPSKEEGACDELCGFTWAGLNAALVAHGSSLTDAVGRVRSTYENNAVAIVAFYRTHGHWPSTRARDHEGKLGRALSKLRTVVPKICLQYGIPLRADLSELRRRDHGKHQFRTLSEIVLQCAHHDNPTAVAESIGQETGPGLNGCLKNCEIAPGQSRGLASAPDRCQVNSIGKLMAEVRANCWRFTLDGRDVPDTRPWSALLDSGDHKLIVAAERTHYLDWEDKSLRGGTRWASANGCVANAIRRTWTTSVQP